MKRGTIVAAVVLVALVAAFLATRKEPATTVVAPYKLAMKDVVRLELTRPQEGGAELVVLEKSDGWRITKPVSAAVEPTIAKELDAVFGKTLRADDIKLSKEKLADYELDEAKAVKVAVFSNGSDQPTAQFSVGKEIVIERTKTRRSFVLSEKGKPYRVQASLEALRKPVKDLRSRVVVKADRASVKEIELIRDPEGQAVKSVLTMSNDKKWQLSGSDMKLEMSVVNGLLSAVSNLTATGFEETKKASELGLDPPMFEVRAKAGEAVVLKVGVVGESYYIRSGDDPQIYAISPNVGKNLTAGPLELRERIPKKLDTKAFTYVEFASDVVAKRTDESWEVVKPSKVKANEGKLMARLTTFARLRVARYSDAGPEVTGLNKPSARVRVKAGKKTYELKFGNPVEGTQEVYATWGDEPFVLSNFIADRLRPSLADVSD